MNTRSAAALRRPAAILLTSTIVVMASFAALAAFGGRGVAGAPLPTVAPSPSPAAVPTDGGTDALPIKVDIDTINGADVHVDIVDETGTVTGAHSGPAATDASVEPYTLQVENIDPTTLRLTWVDYPVANALAMHAFHNDGVLHLVLVQPEPSGPTDSIVFDRVLILELSEPVSADEVVAVLQDGLDTPGWAGHPG